MRDYVGEDKAHLRSSSQERRDRKDKRKEKKEKRARSTSPNGSIQMHAGSPYIPELEQQQDDAVYNMYADVYYRGQPVPNAAGRQGPVPLPTFPPASSHSSPVLPNLATATRSSSGGHATKGSSAPQGPRVIETIVHEPVLERGGAAMTSSSAHLQHPAAVRSSSGGPQSRGPQAIQTIVHEPVLERIGAVETIVHDPVLEGRAATANFGHVFASSHANSSSLGRHGSLLEASLEGAPVRLASSGATMPLSGFAGATEERRFVGEVVHDPVEPHRLGEVVPQVGSSYTSGQFGTSYTSLASSSGYGAKVLVL